MPRTFEEIIGRMPELHSKMLPASRGLMLPRTSKTMRAAVKDSDAVVEVRSGVKFRDGPDLLCKLTSLSACCNVTVLRLQGCFLREDAGRSLAEFLRQNTTLASLDVGYNELGEDGGRPLAEALRFNTTVTEFRIGGNRLCCSAGLAKTLCVNTTLTSLHSAAAQRGRCRQHVHAVLRGRRASS